MPKKKKWTRIRVTGLSVEEFEKELKQLEKTNKKPEQRCYICKRVERKGSFISRSDAESPISLVEKLKIRIYAMTLSSKSEEIFIEYPLCFECATLFRNVLSVYVEDDQELEFKFKRWAKIVKKDLIKEIPEASKKDLKDFLRTEMNASKILIKKCFQYWEKEGLIDKRYLRK